MSPGMSDDLRGKYERAKEETDRNEVLDTFTGGKARRSKDVESERSAATALIAAEIGKGKP